MNIHNTLVVFPPGILILRHPGKGLAPFSLARAPGGPGMHGKFELLSTPGTDGCVLRDDRDCIVLQVLDAPVQFLISAYLTHAGAPVPSLRVDRIALGAAAPAAMAPAPIAVPAVQPQPAGAARAPVAIAAHGLTIIGHVEHLGDTVAAEGKYLGDPASAYRVEGFQIMWPDRPDGVELTYGIALEGMERLPMVPTGKFCGTRNKAKRIIEVTFALVGPQARQYQLEGTICFSGGFSAPVQSGIALSGPSGLEHLTAVSLRAVPTQGAATTAAVKPWDASPQTRIFKAAPASNTAKRPAGKKV